jgi:Domain of unknown function (DUF4918)
MPQFCNHIISFYESLRPPENLPPGIEVLFPQQEPGVLEITRRFYKKYYSDNKKRTLMLGINPGRFGAGATGINFTASKQLTENCGISHSLKMQSELSAEFIYEVIAQYGGSDVFYNEFFIGAISPLGYIQNGKNINYYDNRDLQKSVTPFIISTIEQQSRWNINRDRCICVGDGKNFQFLRKLNDTYSFFKEIIPVPHPRFILQYKRKLKEQYVLQYLNVLHGFT